MQPVYTPLSFLKRFLIGQDSELTIKELAHQLKDFNEYFQSVYRMDIDDVIETTIIQGGDSPFAIDATDTILLDEFPIKVNNIAYDYLVQSGKPTTIEKIIKQLSKRMKTPYDQIEKQLKLVKDIRFVEVYGCDRWLLTEWEICNDEVYNLLIETDSRETNTTHIYRLISTRIQKKEEPRRIWLPEIDNRITVYENGKVIIKEGNREVASNMNHVCANKDQGRQQEQQQQQGELTQQTQQERNSNLQQNDNCENYEVHQKMIEQMEQGLYILKKRSEQMSEEVVQFFNGNNLEAIQILMEEKKANKEFQQDVCKLIEKWKK